jgi:parallel beta-helix repeat protein
MKHRKMRFTITTLVLGLFFNPLTAQFSTPNTGVHWTLDNIAAVSPQTLTVSGNEYTLHENLMVEVNDSLSLNENLILNIDPDVEIEIKGFFRSDADQIMITATDETNPYEGFWFFDTSEVFFRNTVIQYGGGLRVITPNFEMHNCEMYYNVSGSSSGGAISFSNGSPVVKNSIFKYNANPALSSGANTSVSAWIEGNHIEGNNTTNNNRPQINMGPSGEQDTIRIINNIVIGNRDLTMVGGISASSLVGVPNKILIKGNIVKDNRYGITSMGTSTGIIEDNVIEDNNTEGLPMNGGSGINLYSTQLIYLTNNQIRRNLWGLTLQGTAQANLGSDDEEDFNPGGNIFSENGNEGQTYALFNNTSNVIKALHNCWIEGQESTTEDVENVISHVVDDPVLGEVLFDPFDCGEVVLAVGDLDEAEFNIYPNPARNSFYIQSKEKGNIRIFDLNGKLVASEKQDSEILHIQINLPKGVYIVEFESANSNSTKKLIVK